MPACQAPPASLSMGHGQLPRGPRRLNLTWPALCALPPSLLLCRWAPSRHPSARPRRRPLSRPRAAAARRATAAVRAASRRSARATRLCPVSGLGPGTRGAFGKPVQPAAGRPPGSNRQPPTARLWLPITPAPSRCPHRARLPTGGWEQAAKDERKKKNTERAQVGALRRGLAASMGAGRVGTLHCRPCAVPPHLPTYCIAALPSQSSLHAPALAHRRRLLPRRQRRCRSWASRRRPPRSSLQLWAMLWQQQPRHLHLLTRRLETRRSSGVGMPCGRQPATVAINE